MVFGFATWRCDTCTPSLILAALAVGFAPGCSDQASPLDQSSIPTASTASDDSGGGTRPVEPGGSGSGSSVSDPTLRKVVDVACLNVRLRLETSAEAYALVDDMAAQNYSPARVRQFGPKIFISPAVDVRAAVMPEIESSLRVCIQSRAIDDTRIRQMDRELVAASEAFQRAPANDHPMMTKELQKLVAIAKQMDALPIRD